MAEKSADSAYLARQGELLAGIDAAHAEIERGFAASRHSAADTWKLHFHFFYNSLKRQLGWEIEKSKRLRCLDRFLSAVPVPFLGDSLRSLLKPAFMGDSAVWSGPASLAGYPVDAVDYPMAYGFRITTSGLDHWEFAATGHYGREFSETFLMLSLLPAMDAFVDVGANVGFYTLLAGAQSAARVISCEPRSETFQRLTKSVALNGFQQRVTLLNVALGDVPGQQTLHARSIGTGGESLLEVKDERPADSRRVEVRTLDGVMDEHGLTGKKALIKIDVEGYEYAVMSGALGWRKSATPPVFLFESWSDAPVPPRQLIQELRAEGYHLFAIYHPESGGPILKPVKFRVDQNTGNFLAVPAWALDAARRLERSIDLRLFSPTDKLQSLRLFLDNYLASLKKSLAHETAR